MASPIEHFLVILSDAILKKHGESDLPNYALKVAQLCEHAGFPGENGFSIEDPNNKKIVKITTELNKKYKLFPFEKDKKI